MGSALDPRRVLLNDGNYLPILGLGTSSMDEPVKGETVEAVKTAIEIGYRHIDGALMYGNEDEVGEAIRAKIADGTVKREDVFYTSKVWMTYLSPSLVRKGLEKTLKDLQLDYVDLYLVHWPMALKPSENELFPSDASGKNLMDDVDFRETWKVMESCKEAGLVRSIGVSNFNRAQLEMILKMPNLKYKPVCNQVECHPYFNQNKLLKYCQHNNIVLVGYSPLGKLNDPKFVSTEKPILLNDPELKKIGDKLHKTVAQVVLRYQVQRGVVVIPKSFNQGRMKQNLAIFDFELTDEEMETINGLNKNIRYITLEQHIRYLPFPETEQRFAGGTQRVRQRPWIEMGSSKTGCIFLRSKAQGNKVETQKCWRNSAGLAASIGDYVTTPSIHSMMNINEICVCWRDDAAVLECIRATAQPSVLEMSSEKLTEMSLTAQNHRIPLNDGNSIPLIGLGTFSTPRTTDKDACYNAVKIAIDVGYQHFDGAWVYGTEEEVGRAIQEKIADGTVSRDDIYYCGKLWNTYHSPEKVQPFLEKSLKLLNFDYIDLYIIELPLSFKPGDVIYPRDENGKYLYHPTDLCATWEALELCKDAGLVKSIGVSNFNRRQLEQILNKPGLKYKPAVNQVECHPYFTQPKLKAFCDSHDIVIVGYSPLGTCRDPLWVNIKIPSLLEDPVLNCVAAKYKKTSAQVALRYQIQRNVVVIPKSFNPERMKQNFEIFDFYLTDEEMKTIDALNRNERYVELAMWKDHPEYPFNDDY